VPAPGSSDASRQAPECSRAAEPKTGCRVQRLIRQLGWAALIWYLLFIGGTPTGDFNGWSQAANGVLGLGLIYLWLRRAPRAADRLDIAVLGALLLFLASAVVSLMPRQSFGAATQATALVAGFYLARRELGGPSRSTVEAVLGWTCLVVLAVTLPVWIGTWIRWLNLAGWSNPPPLSIWLPGGVFHHRHYLATLIILLAPALWSSGFRHRWPFLSLAGTVGSVCIVVMDASRTLIAAVLIASVVVALMQARRMSPHARRVFRRVSGASAAALVVATVVAAPVLLERMGNLSKLLARFTLWDNSIDVWAHHPVAGVGPGVYPFSYFLTDYFADHIYSPRHPDNAVVQLLTESGLLGLAAVAIVLIAVAAAARHRWRKEPHALWALTAFTVACVGTNPSDFLFLVVPALLWTGMLVPAEPQQWEAPIAARSPSWARRHALSIVAVPVGAAILLTSLASLVYQSARDRYVSGDHVAAAQALDIAIALDPAQAFYWRERGGLRLASANADGARADFERALKSVPFDPGALRGLALANLLSGDGQLAVTTAEKAVHLQPQSILSATVLAVVAQGAGVPNVSRAALARALLEAPYFALVPWTDTVLNRFDRAEALANASRAVGDYRSGETTIGAVLVVIMAAKKDGSSTVNGAIPALTHSARALTAIAGCNAERAMAEIKLAASIERESADFWIASAVISQTLPQSESFGPQFAAMYLGMNSNQGPASSSLVSDGGNDSLRYRREPLEITESNAVMPAPFRGLWLLTNDPLAALSRDGQWPPECGALP
jgi:O-antigen ligase/tetratricopeptide (TPR) repeat protein